MATLLNPASDLVAAVTGQTLGGVALTSGENLFSGVIPQNVSMGVFLLNAGGEAPEPYCGSDSQSVFRSTVVLMVRGVAGSVGYTDSETLARAVLGYLHLRSVSGYISVRALHPHPDFIGNDETGRPQWTAQISAWFKA